MRTSSFLFVFVVGLPLLSISCAEAVVAPCAGVDCSDGNECTSDVCTDGSCSNPAIADGASCDGGDGSCQGGVCQSVSPLCVGVDCSDGNECTSDVCTDGNCSNPASANGTSCDGGNGSCQGGVCQSDTGPCAGVDCSDGNECTSDECTDGNCSNPAIADDTSCDGGDGLCQGGTCIANPTVPNAPTNLRITGTTDIFSDLAFTDNASNEDGFLVYANGGLYRTLGPNETTFQAGPACGSTYRIFVTAQNTVGESPPTMTIDVDGVCLPLLGDKDGFGLGLQAGDFRPVTGPNVSFDNRESTDPPFTDVRPVPVSDPVIYQHTFTPPLASETNRVIRMLTLGIQDGDDQVSGSDIDIHLFLDDLEVPGAFDAVDQFEFRDGQFVETVGLVTINIPQTHSSLLSDGRVTVRLEVEQLGTSTGPDAFAIDYSEIDFF